MVKAYAKINECTESNIASQAIKSFFDNLPPDQKQRIQQTIQQGNY
jgi:hypothetical protein